MDNLKQEVDYDLNYCKEIWKKYSHDITVMEPLFNKMLLKYLNVIENFDKDLKVISVYEENNKKSEICRSNMSIIINKLEDFKNNGYNNERLFEYYINFDDESLSMDEVSRLGFNEARKLISESESIPPKEKEEICDKIDEIEKIYRMLAPKNEKWRLLRPYVMWVSGKSVNVAMLVLSLILKIE
ncbi:MAG: hypothetical protein VB120_03060 [Lachnospiraceae bacterium]|nr:hypothetical protein [Lachnospiraceae bacterium]